MPPQRDAMEITRWDGSPRSRSRPRIVVGLAVAVVAALGGNVRAEPRSGAVLVSTHVDVQFLATSPLHESLASYGAVHPATAFGLGMDVWGGRGRVLCGLGLHLGGNSTTGNVPGPTPGTASTSSFHLFSAVVEASVGYRLYETSDSLVAPISGIGLYENQVKIDADDPSRGGLAVYDVGGLFVPLGVMWSQRVSTTARGKLNVYVGVSARSLFHVVGVAKQTSESPPSFLQYNSTLVMAHLGIGIW